MNKQLKRIDIWHNILWSRYKGGVFSALHKINNSKEFDIRFFQMAETQGDRASLNAVDTSYHTYPYTLLFKGSLDHVGFFKKLAVLVRHSFRSDAALSVLTGYERPEVWAQILILKARRKKVVLFCDATAYDQPQNFLKGLVKRIIFGMADGVLGYGQRTREYVLSYSVNPDRWHMRCQAAALPHDYSHEKALEDRIRLASSSNKPRYLYVGRLSPEKNLIRLLEAFVVVKEEKPEAELVIVGGGPQKAELEEKASALGLDPASIIVGSKSGEDLFEEYAKATCFVLPSTGEPWGLVVNEALHYGCPVIVSERCGCVPELVIEGETGFAHDAFDVDDLAAKMLAAPENFADTEATARECLKLMENYTPDQAAGQMVIGIKAALNNKHMREFK